MTNLTWTEIITKRRPSFPDAVNKPVSQEGGMALLEMANTFIFSDNKRVRDRLLGWYMAMNRMLPKKEYPDARRNAENLRLWIYQVIGLSRRLISRPDMPYPYEKDSKAFDERDESYALTRSAHISLTSTEVAAFVERSDVFEQALAMTEQVKEHVKMVKERYDQTHQKADEKYLAEWEYSRGVIEVTEAYFKESAEAMKILLPELKALQAKSTRSDRYAVVPARGVA